MPTSMQRIKVIPVSPGIAIGKVLKIRHHGYGGAPEKVTIEADFVDAECQRFYSAVETTKKQLRDLLKYLGDNAVNEQKEIIDAYLMLIGDRMFTDEVEKLVRNEKVCAEYALHRAVEHLVEVFSGIPDPYLQERAVDLKDIASRLMANLTHEIIKRHDIDGRRIIVADTLAPSETMQLDPAGVLGFALESGSPTSHTAILARSMRLPAISGLPAEIIDALSPDSLVIIDGFAGRVIINPDDATEESYFAKARNANRLLDELSAEKELHPETKDGFTVEIAANIDSAGQFEEAKKEGAYGVGLFRTEFMFMNSELPDEETQFEVYKNLLLEAGNYPVTIRTLDIGGDKLSGSVARFQEENPALGMRGIRLCLYERRDIFETQLRALLRAGRYGDLRIMLPMVSCVQEIVETKNIINRIQNQLIAEKVEFATRFRLGAMIETPAAALNAGDLAEYVDFFSIGTNDLVQYTMAIDRMNERVAYLNKASSPAILRLINHCVESADLHGIPVAVCGQMAADPVMALLLVGLGVQELSMASPAIPLVRRAIRSVSLYEAEMLAEQAIASADDDQPAKMAEALLHKRAPELLEI